MTILIPNTLKWILILVIIAILPWLLKAYAPALLGRAILVGIFAMLTIGFDMAVGYAGQINLGFQGFFAVGAYTTGILTTRAWVPPLLSEPLMTMVVGCLVAVVICYIISRPVLKTGGFFLAMVTLAFGMIIYSLSMAWDFLGGAYGIYNIPRFHIGPIVFQTDVQFFYLVWFFTMLLCFLSLRLVNSRWGIALRSLHSDEGAAEVTGIDVSKYKMEVFLVSAIYAAIAGNLFAHYMRGLNPQLFSFTLLLVVTLALFFGGMGTIWGSLIGAILIQGLPECVTAIAKYWPKARDTREIIYGLIFVGIILFMPKGIVGTTKEFFSRKREGR